MYSSILVVSMLLGQTPEAQARAALALAAERQKIDAAAVIPDPPTITVTRTAESYSEVTVRAWKARKPIIVYVGCPKRELAGTISHSEDTFNEIDEAGIVVGKLKGDWFIRIDLPANASDADILREAGLVASRPPGKTSGLEPIGNDCGCHFGQACKCLSEGRRCNCNGIRPPTSAAPPAVRQEFIISQPSAAECRS